MYIDIDELFTNPVYARVENMFLFSALANNEWAATKPPWGVVGWPQRTVLVGGLIQGDRPKDAVAGM